MMSWHPLIQVPWVVFLAYWLLSALKTNRTVVRESFAARYSLMLVEAVGFVLLFSHDANIGFFGQQIFPRIETLTVVGVAFTWAGIGLALWARSHLGKYWSGRITLKQDHKLIRTGPYAFFRHPIYSGLDLAVIGTALVINRWRGVAGIVVIFAGFWVKAHREERLLSAQFGEAFEEHRRQTGFLLPKF